MRSVLLLAILCGLVACKPKESAAPAPAPAAQAPAAQSRAAQSRAAPAGAVTSGAVRTAFEACRIHMTLPSEHRWTSTWDPGGVEPSGESPSSAHSMYWASAKEQATLRANKTAMPLDINCHAPGPPAIGVSLAALSSTERDFPLGPGTYRIVGKTGGEVRPGEVLAGVLSFDDHEYDATGGTLVIERFDMEGVAGTFRIDGIESLARNRRLHIEGDFEIPCHGGMLETECRANKVKATVAR